MIEKEQVLWKVCQEMTKNLKANATKIKEKTVDDLAKLTAKPGIFGVFYQGKELGLGISKSGEADLIFVDNVLDLERHLYKTSTGYSSLRRSLAALLASKYDLAAIPRSQDVNDVDRFENYSLDEASEAKLTAWMQENLVFAVMAVSSGEEEQFIQAMVDCNAPILNLRNNKGNLHGADIKMYRKQCVDKAKALAAVEV